MKSIFNPVSTFSVFLVAATLSFTGCNLVSSGYSFNYQGETAETMEQGDFGEGVTQIEVLNKFGDVNVTLAQGDAGWTWEAKVWADSQELADTFLEELSMDVQTEGDKQVWTITMPDSSADLNGVKSNLTFKVPADVKVNLENAHGNIDVGELSANVVLSNGHGNVKVENLSGSVNLTNRHGNLNASNIAGGSINVSHGDLSLNAATGAVSIESGHGKVITVAVEGDLKIDGAHSSISVDGGQNVELKSRHGKITATGIRGNIVASNSHDSTKITTFGETISVKASHGKVEVTAANPGFKSIELETEHNSINLQLPKSVTPAISMSTSHGKSKSEIGSDDNSSQKVTLKNQHGNINVTKADLVAEAQ